MDNLAGKSLIRNTSIEERKHWLSLSENEYLVKKINEQLKQFIEQNNFQNIATYFPLTRKFEIDISPVTSWILISGRSVSLPLINDNEMDMHKILSLDNLIEGPWQTRQPDNLCPVTPAGSLDLIIVPYAAIDFRGNRLGYGKGFYDKYCSLVKSTTKLVSVIPAELISKHLIPIESWDLKLDHVITENEIHIIKNKPDLPA
jgi:5-formyltetrahydrofolate cyclo-ligase